MKNNEMESRGLVSLKLPEKFVNDHPVVATLIYFSPVIIPAGQQAMPAICKGAKYLVDTIADCYRCKVMAENGLMITNIVDDLETIPNDDSIAA